MVSCAFLVAGHRSTHDRRSKPSGRADIRNDNARAHLGASLVDCGHSTRLPGIIARLHRTELARLLAVLHFCKADMDTADCSGLRWVLLRRETGLAHDDCVNVVRPAHPALRLLQRRECVVDRTPWREPGLLRMGICCDHALAELSAQRRECGDIANDLSRDQLGFDRIFREPSLFPLSVVTRGFTTPLVMRKRSTAADMRNPTALAKRFLDSTDVCEPSIQSKASCFGLPGPGESFPRRARLCIDEKQLELKSSMELTQQVIRTRRRLTSEDPLRKTSPESQQTLGGPIPSLAEERVRSLGVP